MAVNIQLDKMSVEEKLQTMESIWDDLCRSENDISSPLWHKKTLEEREQYVQQGQDEFIDWEEAKKDMKSKT